jgi:hypothetical protein
MSTVEDHRAAADRLVAAARDAVGATSAAAQAGRRHRDELVRATGTGPALADRAYRSFAATVGADSVREADLTGVYPLVESADQTYAALIAAANAAAAAATQAQAHAAKMRGS